MDIETQEQQKREGGFTLVELAIVMIIIGLLIGGILKGQELIANSQVTATIAQIKGIDAALSTFKDKYNVLPGDMNNATARLTNCTGSCVNGGGDGRINVPVNAGGAPNIGQENAQAFLHLGAADLISGIDVQGGTANFGSGLPAAKIDGGFWIGYSFNGLITNTTTAADNARPGHYLMFNGIVGAVGGGNGAVPATQAAQIDRKLDDGLPNSGSVFGSTNGGCRNAGLYDEGSSNSCSLAIRVQG